MDFKEKPHSVLPLTTDKRLHEEEGLKRKKRMVKVATQQATKILNDKFNGKLGLA